MQSLDESTISYPPINGLRVICELGYAIVVVPVRQAGQSPPTNKANRLHNKADEAEVNRGKGERCFLLT